MCIQYVHMPVKTKKWQKTKKHKNKPSTERATNSMHKIKQQKKKTVAGQKKAAAATENSSHSKKQKLQHKTVCT